MMRKRTCLACLAAVLLMGAAVLLYRTCRKNGSTVHSILPPTVQLHEGDVVFAVGKNRNVLHNHHVVFRSGEGFFKFSRNFFIGYVVIGKLFRHHIGKALRRFKQAFTGRVIPYGLDDEPCRLFQFFQIHLYAPPVRVPDDFMKLHLDGHVLQLIISYKFHKLRRADSAPHGTYVEPGIVISMEICLNDFLHF